MWLQNSAGSHIWTDVILSPGGIVAGYLVEYPAPGSVGAAGHVSAGEFADYTLVYDLALPDDMGTGVSGTPPYTTNNSGAITPGSFDRIAYYLELDDGSGPQFVWVSMDPSSPPTRP